MISRQTVLTKSQQTCQQIRIEIDKLYEEFVHYYHIVNQLANLQFIQRDSLRQELTRRQLLLKTMIRSAVNSAGESLFVYNHQSYEQHSFFWGCYNIDNASDYQTITLPKLRLIIDPKHSEYIFHEPITTYPIETREYYQQLLPQIQNILSKLEQYKEILPS